MHMYIPAEIHRRGYAGAETTVAKGPLVIMAHGLLALSVNEHEEFWIKSAEGDLTADQAAAALRAWHGAPRH